MKEGQPKAILLKDYQVPAYLIDSTELHVEINDDITLVTTTLIVRKNPESTGATSDLVLDGGKDLVTRSIKINDRDLLSNEYAEQAESLTLFSVPENFTLSTQVAIKPQDNTGLEGLYKSGDMYCTQCEAQGFRNITWYLDRPDVMSKYRTTIDANKSQYPILLSNGNDVARGESGERHWVTWEDPFMKPAYLFALVAGDLQHIEDSFTTMSGREVKLQIFTEAHNIDKCDYAMLSLKNSMKWDEEAYGREYDLDIFMIVAVESFNMGAMENKGLNIFNTSCVLARSDTTTDLGYQRVEAVVGHEYFHNWSGNRVTCRDWFQLSLKEGFTVLRDQQFSAAMGSPTVCRINDVAALRGAQFPEDAGPMAHPIRPDAYIEINNFYTATVYEKGAEVVHMIRTLLGADNFRKGTDLYFDRHDGQAVTTEEFVKAMEDANGADLTQFRHWYSQAGTPVLKLDGEYDAAAATYTLNVVQHCPATRGQTDKLPNHMPLCVGLLGSAGQDMPLTVRAASNGVSPLAYIEEGAESNDSQQTAVLNLTNAQQQFVFEGVTEKPVPSLLRGFSAPVKLSFDYSRDELMFLMSFDADGFNRWEASQRLAVQVIEEVVGQIQQGDKPEVDARLIKACQNNLDQAVERNLDPTFDKAMIAEMLQLPSETYLAELVAVADVDAIHGAREAVREAIARQLSGVLLSVYKLNQDDKAFDPSATECARRSLKNVALAYLMQPDDTEMVDLCVAQYKAANCMTDTSAALRALVNSAAPAAQKAKEDALTQFYNRWVDEALVIDQWFSVQASSHLPGTLEKVRALFEHPAFTLKNPNRLRSVVVAFAFQNNVNFHQKDGGGYAFLADQVIALNSINPLVAARILSPLTRWRKYDETRQGLMKAQLQKILETPELSKDVFEVVSKSV
jgi:aminopeptidase N